jgi:hypothetical protein
MSPFDYLQKRNSAVAAYDCGVWLDDVLKSQPYPRQLFSASHRHQGRMKELESQGRSAPIPNRAIGASSAFQPSDKSAERSFEVFQANIQVLRNDPDLTHGIVVDKRAADGANSHDVESPITYTLQLILPIEYKPMIETLDLHKAAKPFKELCAFLHKYQYHGPRKDSMQISSFESRLRALAEGRELEVNNNRG